MNQEIYYKAVIIPTFTYSNLQILYEEVLIYKRTKKGVWYFSHYDIKNGKDVYKFICESRKIHNWKWDQLEHIKLNEFKETPTQMRYAWPTKKEALISLKFKNIKYIRILNDKLKKAENDCFIITNAIYDMNNPNRI